MQRLEAERADGEAVDPGLDADDEAGVARGHLRAQSLVEVGAVRELEARGGEADARDVQEGAHAGRAAAGDVVAQPVDAVGAGGTRVDPRGDTGAGGERVGVDAPVGEARQDVRVQVHEAGDDEQARGVGDRGADALERRRDRGDPAVPHADVRVEHAGSRRIDHAPAGDDQVKRRPDRTDHAIVIVDKWQQRPLGRGGPRCVGGHAAAQRDQSEPSGPGSKAHARRPHLARNHRPRTGSRSAWSFAGAGKATVSRIARKDLLIGRSISLGVRAAGDPRDASMTSASWQASC